MTEWTDPSFVAQRRPSVTVGDVYQMSGSGRLRYHNVIVTAEVTLPRRTRRYIKIAYEMYKVSINDVKQDVTLIRLPCLLLFLKQLATTTTTTIEELKSTQRAQNFRQLSGRMSKICRIAKSGDNISNHG